MDQYIGKMLDDRYELLEVIGTGGMAVVYKGRDHRLNRLVAVKILREDLARDAEFRRRFHDESQAVAMLSHPNIMAVYDVSHSAELDYIVMELLDGITLKQYMQKKGGKLAWREALHFITQIMKALSHAHSRGIIHRDIKPHNIMVLRDGSLKVADFGIARLTSAAQATLTQEALGSVHYISPEQARGSHIDARSDIYSAGVVLYEMLTGRLPFEGDSAVSVAIQHLSSVPLAPREINPDIPEQLELICMKAMAPDLDKRYPSADAMIADLEAFRKNPGVNLDFELSDLRTEESDEPTQKLRTPVPPQSHRPGRESSYERSRRYEDDRYDERPSRLSGGKKAALIGGGAVVVVVVLFFLFRAIFASMVPAAADTYAVPRLIGMTEEQANQQASVADGTFQVVVAGTEASDAAVGEIVRQDPEPETEKKGELPITINVWVSAGEDVGTMPDLTSTPVTYEQALTILQDLVEEYELNIQPYEETQKEYDDELAVDVIKSTTPAANEELHKGDTITFVLSRGPQTVPLIDCVGQERSWAEDQLKNVLGLEVVVHEEASDTVQEGYIIRQDPTGTTEVPAGSTVELWVSTGPDSSAQEEGSYLLIVPLPTDRDSVVIQVIQDGEEVYNAPVDCSQGNFVRELTGVGSAQVQVYMDGELLDSYSGEVPFDGI